MLANDMQLLKDDSPKEVTEEGIVISFNFKHSEKVKLPIIVTFDGISMRVNDEQPLNA